MGCSAPGKPAFKPEEALLRVTLAVVVSTAVAYEIGNFFPPFLPVLIRILFNCRLLNACDHSWNLSKIRPLTPKPIFHNYLI